MEIWQYGLTTNMAVDLRGWTTKGQIERVAMTLMKDHPEKMIQQSNTADYYKNE